MKIQGCFLTNKVFSFRSIGIGALLSIGLCLFLLSPPMAAQEEVPVSTDDGLLIFYDFATNSLIETVKGSLGFNPRTRRSALGAYRLPDPTIAWRSM